MPQSLSKIIIHIVFATKHRTNIIDNSRLTSLHSYIAGICRQKKAEAYRVGGTQNHIHIACILPRTITIAKLVEEIKKASSKWMKLGKNATPFFQWQDGYGAFSISQSHLPALIGYIDNQEAHHQESSFEDEVREICGRYDVDAGVVLEEVEDEMNRTATYPHK